MTVSRQVPEETTTGDDQLCQLCSTSMPRSSCQNPTNCHAAGRGGPCRRCDAQAIAQRAVELRQRILANKAEGRPLYAPRNTEQGAGPST